MAGERQAAAQKAAAQYKASTPVSPAKPPEMLPANALYSPMPFASPPSEHEGQGFIQEIVNIFAFRILVLPALVRIIHALVVVPGIGAFSISAFTAAIAVATSRGEIGVEAFIFPLMVSCGAMCAWLAVRLSLESIMIVFRIEEHLRKD